MARSHRLYALFYLVLTTGLRLGEVLELVWADVEDDAIVIRCTVSTRSGTPVGSEPKSASGRRVIAIDGATRRVLQEHADRQRAELTYLGVAESEIPERVFTSELGRTLDGSNVSRIWHRLQTTAGVPRARIHDLRHMHLSMLVGKGIHIRTVSARAGHADAVLTLRRYTHALEAQRKRAAIPLDELLEE